MVVSRPWERPKVGLVETPCLIRDPFRVWVEVGSTKRLARDPFRGVKDYVSVPDERKHQVQFGWKGHVRGRRGERVPRPQTGDERVGRRYLLWMGRIKGLYPLFLVCESVKSCCSPHHVGLLRFLTKGLSNLRSHRVYPILRLLDLTSRRPPVSRPEPRTLVQGPTGLLLNRVSRFSGFYLVLVLRQPRQFRRRFLGLGRV